MAIRELRGKGEHEEVLRHCEAVLQLASNGVHPKMDDATWHELAVHQSAALAATWGNRVAVEELLIYAIDYTPKDVLTLPFAMAVCDLVMLHHQRGGIDKEDYELLMALLERMQ